MGTRQRSISRISYIDLRELDNTLEALQLRRHSVPNDGNSFFSAVSHQLSLFGKQMLQQNVRRKCVEYLRSHDMIGDILWMRALDTGETKEEYLMRNSMDGELADEIIIQAAAASLHYVIRVVSVEETVQFEPYSTAMGEIHVAKVNGFNFVSLEGNPKIEEWNLPRLFSLRDLVSTRGILKQTRTGEASSPLQKNAENFDNVTNQNIYENDGGTEEKPGFNPLDDDNDFFSTNEEENLLEKPPYDQFICEPPEDDARTTTPLIKFFTKLFKLLSYFIFGAIVLGSGLISKASLMVLVNSAKPFVPTESSTENDKTDHDIIRIWSYIILLITMLVPEVLTMVYSIYRIVMKPEKRVEVGTLLWGLLWEVLHAFGEVILVIRVFPHLDATYAFLVMPLVAIVPIILHVHAKYLSVLDNKSSQAQYDSSMQYERIRNLIMAITALFLQLAGIISLFGGFFTKNGCHAHQNCYENSSWFCFLCVDYTYIWTFVGLILTSLRYWENFVSGTFTITENFKIRMWKLHSQTDTARFQTSLVYSFVKCVMVTGATFLIFVVLESDSYSSARITKVESIEKFNEILASFSFRFGRPRTREIILQKLWFVFVVQICASFVTFFIARVSCLTMIQRESYTLPLTLITPTLSAISAALGVYKNEVAGEPLAIRDMASFFGLTSVTDIRYLRSYIDWNNMVSVTTINDVAKGSQFNAGFAAIYVIVGLLLGWLGILLITHFLWNNPINRLEKMEMLFVKPLYGGLLIDQIMLLNRRQYEHEYNENMLKRDAEEEKKRTEKEERERSSSGSVRRRKSSRRATISRGHKFVPQLFLCATMWHETEQEMTQMLTSLMRLDRDQGNRRANARNDEDYYNFQVHILFDDAMERTKDNKEVTTNKFVHMLCDLISLAANKVELGKGYNLPLPVIYPTPYGGRLEFVMPHGNLLIVHLKDKDKIRHRKRWSQCMYMYYILGYLQATKKAYKLEDIFILALDGDVDFQPNAVLLLLDRMKRNPDVGAACGRIHPTGSGPVVWFQKFEYAVGHWLQKTAEHVLGCVLCSPGCFSLFRGSALVDVNVVHQYTSKSSKARHYVQWDQGEDRWLCTLLLKQGWRIEYSAASDSFTFAPESFNEFYNQRRRWGPSTMANVFDILTESGRAVENNIYISWGYIAYQLGLMISSLLGPATVIMIVQGALQYVFSWDATLSLLVSLIPVIIFIILCYTTSSDTQLAVAALLTILYALVMTMVLVGVIGTMVNNFFLDPNNIFTTILVGLYFFTGVLHPQEILCLMHGLLYYLCVPSAFILLMVYSLTNMNNVSWGTREVKKSFTDDSSNEQALQQVAAKPGKKFQLGPDSIYDAPQSSEGYYSCGLGNLCQCALCITPRAMSGPMSAQHTVNTHQPTRRTTQANQRRRTTMGNQARQSMFKRFSVAKAQQVTGMEDQKLGSEIEQRLEKRMSLAQLRRISTRIGPDGITTSQLRRISSQQRRQSQKSSERTNEDKPNPIISEASAILSRELAQEQEYFDNLSDDYDMYDDDDMVDAERMQDEEEEMLYWLIEGSLEDGVIEYLDDEERDFWKYMIQNYLYPLEENKEEKAKIKAELKGLRNSVTGAYFLMNALWLILNFALQLTITDIAITFTIQGNEISVNPVSFLFLIFFLVILIIQFTCMLVHRWSTALHLLSVTSLKWRDGREGIKNVKNKDMMRAEMIQKMRKKKAPMNGQVFGESVPDALDRQISDENNFSMKRRKSSVGYANSGFLRDIEQDEDTTVTEDDTSVEMYEKINIKRFDSNPANRMFGSVTKNYLTTENENDTRKTSTNIDLAIFYDSNAGKNISKNAKKQQEKQAEADDFLEKPIHAEVHHQKKDHDHKMKGQAGVHFGPLPTSDHNVEDENTAC